VTQLSRFKTGSRITIRRANMPTFTFSDPPTTYKDWFRLYTGDTDLLDENQNSNGILSDETISSVISSLGWVRGCKQLIDAMIAKISKEPDVLQEGHGILTKFLSRIPELRKIREKIDSGEIEDPISPSSTSSGSISTQGSITSSW